MLRWISKRSAICRLGAGRLSVHPRQSRRHHAEILLPATQRQRRQGEVRRVDHGGVRRSGGDPATRSARLQRRSHVRRAHRALLRLPAVSVRGAAMCGENRRRRSVHQGRGSQTRGHVHGCGDRAANRGSKDRGVTGSGVGVVRARSRRSGPWRSEPRRSGRPAARGRTDRPLGQQS